MPLSLDTIVHEGEAEVHEDATEAREDAAEALGDRNPDIDDTDHKTMTKTTVTVDSVAAENDKPKI